MCPELISPRIGLGELISYWLEKYARNVYLHGSMNCRWLERTGGSPVMPQCVIKRLNLNLKVVLVTASLVTAGVISSTSGFGTRRSFNLVGACIVDSREEDQAVARACTTNDGRQDCLVSLIKKRGEHNSLSSKDQMMLSLIKLYEKIRTFMIILNIL
jgi:hypothetical protein